jgi:hypothetical protein
MADKKVIMKVLKDPNEALVRCTGRSQWPRGLRHELSSPAQTLGEWFRIPLEARIFVYAFILLTASVV